MRANEWIGDKGLEQVFIREVFIIKTEQIDLFGAIVRKPGGDIQGTGRVVFQDGTVWVFDSPEAGPEDLRKMLTALCSRLAAHYGTEVFNLKFHREISSDDFVEKLREAKRETVIH